MWKVEQKKMVDPENVNELNARLSSLSPAKRAWLEQRLRTSLKKGPIGKSRVAVVQLQAGSSELPLYFINAGPFEIRLAQMIGVGHSIFGIEIPWPLSWRDAAANNETAALPTMEQLVAPVVAELSTHVRSSPCVLAGHSFGGVMAFEAAHQLQRLGVKVKMVMLLDTWLKNPPLVYATPGKVRQGRIRALYKLWAEQSEHLIGSRLRRAWFLWWILVKGTKRIFRLLRPSFVTLSHQVDEQGVPLPWALIYRLYDNAIKSYDPLLLDCHGVLFRADEGEKDQEYPRAFDGSLGWKDLFGKGLEINLITGNHFTIIGEELARKMIEVLKRYSTSEGGALGI